ncbi:MAG: M48 family metalloprotease [Planctomycetes bacterium]|nr:M48 family metalloprotease [Planctomycetota bacterium]
MDGWRSIPFAIALGLTAVGSWAPAADDPPKTKGNAKSLPRPSRRPGRFDDPPPCRHQTSVSNAPSAHAPTRRPLGPGMDQTGMPVIFDRMMENMMRNPAGGFQDFLKEQETSALRSVSLSAAEERTLGRKARDEFLRQAAARGSRAIEDQKRIDYLRALIDALSKRMRNRARYPRIDVSLIEAPVPDGQSFPGGFLVFTTALLREPDEATVAGVVAHELAHLDKGHLYEYACRAKLSESAFRPQPGSGVTFDQFMSQGMALGSLMMNPFRPEHETEADCAATTWMYQEGYDPRALVEFFERLHNRLKDQPDLPFFRFGRTHPYSLERRREVLDRLQQLQQWRPRRDLGRYPDNLRRLVARGPEPAAR